MPFKLQNVAYTDLDILVTQAITAEAFLPLLKDEGSFLRNIPTYFGNHPHFQSFILLENEVQEAGFILLLPHKNDATLSIGPMYISKPYQGRGLGRYLVEGVIKWANSRGFETLFTQTWGENIRSRRIFEGLGFCCVGEFPKTRNNGDSTIHYLLRISEVDA